jgi:hypothetical protein
MKQIAPPARAPVIYAAEASEPIRVDGKVNEACWRNAPLVNNFFRIEPAGYANNQFSRVGEHRLDVTIDVYSAELRLAYNPRIQASRFYQYNSLDQQGRWK